MTDIIKSNKNESESETAITLTYPDLSMYIDQIISLTDVLYLAAENLDNSASMMHTLLLLRRMIKEIETKYYEGTTKVIEK
ncbi:MAG: hypothetical protein HND52_03680 [Ignavibacteriae bacterium]|nr:hypothetical protein [Ignavibacteriota bacterium]NOG97056.1 hypothetical protein [Ignavibacteriota bacterium]